jgi:uncharacterized RDD family membrane protein YckC
MAATTLEAPAKPPSWHEEALRDQIDTNVDIVTPENIAFNYRVAGPFRRLPAYLIDLGIRAILLFVLAILFGIISAFAGSSFVFAVLFAVWILTWFVTQWFYGGFFETYWNGQTPGKKLLGLRVLTVEGQPVNMLQATMRNVLRAADFLPPLLLNIFQPLDTLDSNFNSEPLPPYPIAMTLLAGLIVMMMNNRYQRLGDLVCGTMVVIEERSWLMGIARLEDPRAAQLAQYLPPNYVVSRSLAKTLATYVERRQYFSLNRRREIARHLAEPLLDRFGLPHDTSHDLLLCALYYRTFIADRGKEDAPAAPSPFKPIAPPAPAWGPSPPPPVNIGEIRIRT